MPKKGHTEEQIVAVLRQVEAGAKVGEICRKVGISQATYYLWKRQYSGVGVSELRELRQLREENGRLKRLVDRSMLRSTDPARDRVKKAVRPRARRKLARWAQEAYRISERHGARLVKLAIGTLRYQSRKVFDEVLRERLREIRLGHGRSICVLCARGISVCPIGAGTFGCGTRFFPYHRLSADGSRASSRRDQPVSTAGFLRRNEFCDLAIVVRPAQFMVGAQRRRSNDIYQQRSSPQ